MPSSYTLGNHFESFVKQMVASGRYASASEVMRGGLRLMEERERLRASRLEALRQSIREGLESGAAEPLDMNEIIQNAQGRRARKAAAQG